ncbi:hypothetical protein BV25DRAFT_895870 [Artomyces pyxidatus]|uniref:Uncharacterized protein n=1 Tax=Artomyces pyxidatus TaxID=48021 RepID=A0ACB8THS2_9AGAM|nr:hypothetical protein BV25DRAFT_895870 [Artomyces pyxidatus]
MADRVTGRPWTSQEDQQLTKAVEEFGENADWKTIAVHVPGRTNKACRKRWLHSLSPSIKKSAWTREEDETLLTLYRAQGAKWSVIARHIPGRTDDACSKRYREALDPSLKKDDWTEAEDARLLDLYARLGGKWVAVGNELKRSSLGCRNRWRLLERKRASALRNDAPSEFSTFPVQPSPIEPPGDLTAPWGIFDQFWSMQLTPAMLSPEMAVGMQSHPSVAGTVIPSSANVSGLGDPFHVDAALTPSYHYSNSSLGASFDASGSRHGLAFSEPPVSSHGDFHGDTNQLGSEVSPVTMDYETHPPPTEHHMNMDVDDAARSPHAHSPDHMYERYSPPRPSEPPYDQDENIATENIISTPTSPAPIAQPPSVPAPVPASPSFTPAAGPSIDNTSHNPPTSFYRSSAARPVVPRVSKRREHGSQSPPPRLSSNLAASPDPSVLGYACGDPKCWTDSLDGPARYATSKELSDHCRSEHQLDQVTDPDHKPYRCGLQGCGKGWKSVNGLQYHLQVSKAHFLQAITTFTATDPNRITVQGDQPPGVDALPPSSKKPKKIHPCPHPNCLQVYKQLSGLRYHLSHGHPHGSPAQLDKVPPTLARKVTEKMQRQVAGV